MIVLNARAEYKGRFSTDLEVGRLMTVKKFQLVIVRRVIL